MLFRYGDKRIATYVPLEEIYKVCNEYFGNKFDVNAYIDDRLGEEYLLQYNKIKDDHKSIVRQEYEINQIDELYYWNEKENKINPKLLNEVNTILIYNCKI